MKFGPVAPGDALGATAVHSIRQGELVLKKGTLIGPAEVTALQAAGVKEIVVARLELGDVSEDQAAAEIAAAVAGAGVRADFLRPHSVFEAKCPLRFKGKVLWAFSQSGKSTDVARCLEKIVGWGARAVAVTNEPDMAENPIARAACRHILLSSSRERAVAATKTFALQLWLALWTAQVWSGCFREKDFCETARLIKSLLEDSGRFLRKDAFPF